MILKKIRLTTTDIEKYSDFEFRKQACDYLKCIENCMMIDTCYVPSELREHYRNLRNEINDFCWDIRHFLECYKEEDSNEEDNI